MYVVTVEFKINLQRLDEFMAAMNAQAHQSLELEPGCLQFDVCTSEASPERVFLYEAYQDRSAFDAHLNSKHFISFDELVQPMLVKKSVQTWHLIGKN